MAIKIKHFNTRVVQYPALALAALAAVVALGFDRCLSKGDWGTWVGAVGTVGTLIGTIWLATTERRIRRKQEAAFAQVTAASFVERIRVFENLLSRSIAIMEKFERDISRADFEGLHRINSRGGIWSPADTIPLLILPGKTAVKLSVFAMKFDTTQQNLVVMHESHRNENMQIQVARCRDQINQYQHLLTILGEVKGFCLYAYLEVSES